MCFLLRNVSFKAVTSITFSFRYNSSSLRFGLHDKLAIPKQNVCTHETDQRIPVMVEDALPWPTIDRTYLEVSGCLGTALVVFLGAIMDFSTVDALGMFLETGLTLVLVNVKGLGGAGALREPIDSNRSFPVVYTFSILSAASQTL